MVYHYTIFCASKFARKMSKRTNDQEKCVFSQIATKALDNRSVFDIFFSFNESQWVLIWSKLQKSIQRREEKNDLGGMPLQLTVQTSKLEEGIY